MASSSSSSSTEVVAVDHYYGYNSDRSGGRKPSALLNSIFMWTVNRAAKTLVAVASSAKTSTDHDHEIRRWRAADHMRFMVMLITWFTVWVLRVLMDHFPTLPAPASSSSATYLHLHQGFSSPLLLDDDLDLSSSSTTSSSSLDLLLQQGYCTATDHGALPSLKALGRSLSHIFALLNDVPASSRKYQFAVAMADKIVEENARSGHVGLLQINRAALSSAFARTASLLHRSIQSCCSSQLAAVDSSASGGAWTSGVIGALPLGSYLTSYLKGLSNLCLGAIFPNITGTSTSQLRKQQRRLAAGEESSGEVVAEKHAHELMWITNKLTACGAVDEALMQWSLSSGLASLSLTANPRLQGFIVKISAILFGELTRRNLEVPRQVKFRLLVLWLPLFCYAENGLAYPVLTGYEKAEMERTMDEVISTLPAMDQEVILTNWLQDFSISTSDWPNLQTSYDRWCHSTRKLVT